MYTSDTAGALSTCLKHLLPSKKYICLLLSGFEVQSCKDKCKLEGYASVEFDWMFFIFQNTTYAKDLPFLALAPDGSAEAGTRIAIIGSPLGLEGTLTEGIVSARRRLPKEKRDVLQISAPISQGSSGSPVLDSQGRVIGVASFLLQDGQSLNFASPSEQLRKLLGKRTLKTTPPPPLQKNPPVTYTVKQGDTLIQISRELEKQGVSATAEQIRTLNQIPKSSVIRRGQVLRIPQSQP
jgi:LysM repeat protein